MVKLQSRIENLLQATENWLNTNNPYLERAKIKTVEQGYSNAFDVQFAINVLKETINRDALEAWIEQAGISDVQNGVGQNIMCLHAGNLPLVGLQDVLAVLLSGARYTGKISKKDPYLLPTFLNEIKKTEAWSDIDVQWAHNLRDFEGMQSDAILFAGSENSIPGVMQSLDNLELNQTNPEKLIRTAHFSIACLSDTSTDSLKDLVDGMLRYSGQGCRSVAGVISPDPLSNVEGKLKELAHQFWESNPQHQKPQTKLRQQFAYNKAIENSQVWLEDFLIHEGVADNPADFTCFWVQGDGQTTADLASQFGEKIQSIYATDMDTKIPGYAKKTEPLSTAQEPPIYWKPDGVDTLNWLCTDKSKS